MGVISDHREQAIRDVAAATLSGRGCRCRESLLHDYAVALRERVLELEAFLGKVINVNAASTEPDAAELSDALGRLAYEAMKLQAQLQQKEGERG